jgi:hypothetical protein
MGGGFARRGKVVSLVLEGQAEYIFEETQRHCETLSRSSVSILSSHICKWLYSSSHSDCVPWQACGRAKSHLLARESAIQSPWDFRDREYSSG